MSLPAIREIYRVNPRASTPRLSRAMKLRFGWLAVGGGHQTKPDWRVLTAGGLVYQKAQRCRVLFCTAPPKKTIYRAGDRQVWQYYAAGVGEKRPERGQRRVPSAITKPTRTPTDEARNPAGSGPECESITSGLVEWNSALVPAPAAARKFTDRPDGSKSRVEGLRKTWCTQWPRPCDDGARGKRGNVACFRRHRRGSLATAEGQRNAGHALSPKPGRPDLRINQQLGKCSMGGAANGRQIRERCIDRHGVLALGTRRMRAPVRGRLFDRRYVGTIPTQTESVEAGRLQKDPVLMFLRPLRAGKAVLTAVRPRPAWTAYGSICLKTSPPDSTMYGDKWGVRYQRC